MGSTSTSCFPAMSLLLGVGLSAVLSPEVREVVAQSCAAALLVDRLGQENRDCSSLSQGS